MNMSTQFKPNRLHNTVARQHMRRLLARTSRTSAQPLFQTARPLATSHTPPNMAGTKVCSAKPPPLWNKGTAKKRKTRYTFNLKITGLVPETESEAILEGLRLLPDDIKLRSVTYLALSAKQQVPKADKLLFYGVLMEKSPQFRPYKQTLLNGLFYTQVEEERSTDPTPTRVSKAKHTKFDTDSVNATFDTDKTYDHRVQQSEDGVLRTLAEKRANDDVVLGQLSLREFESQENSEVESATQIFHELFETQENQVEESKLQNSSVPLTSNFNFDDIFDKYHQDAIPTDLLDRLTAERLKTLKLYFAEVDSTRHSHPRLQNQSTFNSFAKTLITVNDKRTVLISLDIEAHEFDTNKITEIGISIYDPSREALSTIPQFTTIHLLPKEYLHLRNGIYVPDHKHDFLGGRSLTLPLKECTKFMRTLFDHYFIKRKAQGFHPVIVGHDVGGDLKWLRSMNVSVPNDVTIADTQSIQKSVCGEQFSLSKMLTYFQIPHSHLHNGANDAYFTLLLMMHLADPNFRKSHKIDSPEFKETFLEKMKHCKASTTKADLQGKSSRKRVKPVQYAPISCSNHVDALKHTFAK